MLSAVFLDDCVTVHDYKNKIETLGNAAGRKVFEYQIAECYVMKYEDFIYLCNHLNERRTFFKPKVTESGILQVSLFYCTRADRVLLVHTKKNGIAGNIAVLYNAGDKVDIRPWCHRSRDCRNAEKRRQQELQTQNDMV